MPRYVNFHNHRGLSFHEFALPGRPASHACVRLLERDAQWLFEWGESWTLDERGWTVLDRGTPVLILVCYDFTAPPPWRSLEWLARALSFRRIHRLLLTSASDCVCAASRPRRFEGDGPAPQFRIHR